MGNNTFHGAANYNGESMFTAHTGNIFASRVEPQNLLAGNNLTITAPTNNGPSPA